VQLYLRRTWLELTGNLFGFHTWSLDSREGKYRERMCSFEKGNNGEKSTEDGLERKEC